MKIESRIQNGDRRRLPQPAPDLAHRVSLSPATPSRITDHASRITHHPPSTRHSQKGVALVITLILLSVITFMAITFLVVSRNEKGSVSTQTDLTIARLAADTGRERAIAEVLSPMLATANPFNYGLMVSANYVNTKGFNPAGANTDPADPPDPLNVNYDIKAGSSGPFTPLEWQRNIANLWYNPRPPVVIVTNASPQPGWPSNEFRFYVDLNRNRMFDPTGPVMETNTGLVSLEIGDPQWIGVLQRPELAHSAENLFASRYAYLVVPVGQTLDINAIHNYGKLLNGGTGGTMGGLDEFMRNQGILPSEINLAAFLADLNTNLWPCFNQSPAPFSFSPYLYSTDLSTPNDGAAFNDAVGMLRYRYNYNSKSLATVSGLLGGPGGIAFSNSMDAVDVYGAGPLMIGNWWPPSGSASPNPNQTRVTQNYPWSGSYSPNAFFTTQDLFDERKTANPASPSWNFTRRLLMAGTNSSTYNRYTFYRLLSQLGTDSAPSSLHSQLGTVSAPEPQNKMNLNYRNVDDNGYVVPSLATNFYSWEAGRFFTNAAIRLLADAGYTVGDPGYATNLLVTNYTAAGVLVTNLQIPIWPTNFYTPSVHRLFQLAANIYDATTNRLDLPVTNYPFLPSVFRPIFTDSTLGGQRRVFITGYQPLSSVNPNDVKDLVVGPSTTCRPRDLSEPTNSVAGISSNMVYNVPLVIGAKKGLPSFDEATMDTRIQIARKLIFHRTGSSADGPIKAIVPTYLLTITNEVGLQAWNSYATTFNRNLQIQVWPDVSVLVSNRLTHKLLNNTAPLWNRYPNAPTNYYVGGWPGYNPPFVIENSFITPLGAPTTNYVFMPTNSVYLPAPQDAFIVNGTPAWSEGQTNFTVPPLHITIKARLRFAIIDISKPATPQLLDYVNVAVNKEVDLIDALMHNPDGSFACGQSYTPVYSKGAMWCTNINTGIGADPKMTSGVRLQIAASMDAVSGTEWNDSLPDPVYGTDKAKAKARFRAQFFTDPKYPKVNMFGAPFQPYRDIHVVTLLQANDPLVHYTVGDLKNTTELTNAYYLDRLPDAQNLPPTPYWGVNKRHEPWGGNPVAGSGSTTMTDWRVKDSVAGLAGKSDHWDFPANKMPNVGWLGRVHRGTPWQTVYLKSSDIDFPTWFRWSGNDLWVTNFGQFPWTNMPQFTNIVVGGITNQCAWDSAFTTPKNDWRLLDIFSTSVDPSATRGRLSINQTNLAAWSAVLSGVIVLTNNGVDAAGNGLMSPAVIDPAGVYDPNASTNTWPAVVKIVSGINAARSKMATPTTPVFPNQVFHRLGDILSVPELTEASPFLSALMAPSTPPAIPLSDATFERIPQQILGLLKCDETPRVVVYTFGQTLKPAPRSRVTSGPFFGLCTNYQITAEVVTRSVVRFDGVPAYKQGNPEPINKLHPVIESFSVLPTE